MFNPNQFFPLANTAGTANLLKKGFSWSGLLSNAQKTLGVINQAIPVFYQIKPMWNNAKTMFKVFGEFSKLNKNGNGNQTAASNSSVTTSSSDSNTNTTTSQPVSNSTNDTTTVNSNSPRFFA